MKHLPISRLLSLALTACLVSTACQTDLELDDRQFACDTDEDCLESRVCAPAPGGGDICQEPVADAGQDGDAEADTDTGDADACTPQIFFVDEDGDGFGASVEQCEKPANTVDEGGDCDDDDARVYPGAGEVCDGRDSNCDGTPDQNDAASAASCFSQREQLIQIGDAGNEVVDEVLFVERSSVEASPGPTIIAGRYDADTEFALGGSAVALPGEGAFIARLDENGQREWVVSLATQNPVSAPMVDLDQAGNTYVAVRFTDGLAIYESPQSTPVTYSTTDGKTDSVVLALSNTGVLEGTNHFRGAEQQAIEALSVGLDDRPYVAGNFARNLTTDTITETSGTETRTAFVARLTPQLTVVDSAAPEIIFLRNTDGVTAHRISIDAMDVIEDDNQSGTNEVYLAGRFQDRLQLGSDVFFEGAGEQAFTGKLHFNGDGSVEREWISVIETTDSVRITDIAAVTARSGDSDDAMVIGGWFSGRLRLPGEPDAERWTSDSTDGFLAALASGGTEGSLGWKQRVSGPDDQRIQSLSIPYYFIEGHGESFPIYATCDITGVTTIDDGTAVSSSGQPDQQDALLIWFGNDDSGLTAPVVGGLDHYTSTEVITLRSVAAQSVVETAAINPPRRIRTGGAFSGVFPLSLTGTPDAPEAVAEDRDAFFIDGEFPGIDPEIASF